MVIISMDEKNVLMTFAVKGSTSSNAFAEKIVEAAHMKAAPMERISPSTVSHHDMRMPFVRPHISVVVLNLSQGDGKHLKAFYMS